MSSLRVVKTKWEIVYNEAMRSFFRRFLPLFVCLCCLSSTRCRAEVIRSYDVAVRLQKDTTLDVTETIVYDFENAQKHGIFRYVPVRYNRNGNTYSLYLDVQSVTDENGRALHYVQSWRGDSVELKIGDKDVLLTGLHTYTMRYLVRRAVNFFRGAPEVYWNATGNEWPTPIEKASCRFYPPPGVPISSIRAQAFRGFLGSTELAQTAPQNDSIVFSTTDLASQQGLTIVVGLPKNSVVQPSALQTFWWFFKDWWGLFLLPLLTAALLWKRYSATGRDIGGGQAVAVEWNPPKDLSPAEVGTLIDEKCDMADIVSTLVDLAARGYLRIEETKQEKLLFLSSTDYIFTRTSSTRSDLSAHETLFLNGLFSAGETVTLSSLKEKFYTYLPGIKKAIYESVTNKGLFASNPETVRGTYFGFGIMACVGGVIAAFFLPNFGLSSVGWGLLVSGMLILLFARAMPSRTALGSQRLHECQGFQRFVKLAEKDRIAVLAKEDPTIFGRLLPYAMVLGVADQWAYAFKDLMTEPPDWYTPYGYGYGSGFNSMLFVHGLGNGMNTMGNTFSSAPSSTAGSGGSGFSGGGSGGGFGGGGGGSW